MVHRFGAKLPLIIGPLIASFGFALFTLPGAGAKSYWSSFFPAVLVMSLGMVASVAPLTTTVMGSVEDRHAGTASGINNAVSRTAGLISIAVLGVVMTGVFTRKLDSSLQQLDLSAETRAKLEAQASRLATIAIPDDVVGESREEVKRDIDDAFVSGFRVVVLIAAGLALGSGVFSWLLIEGPAALVSTSQAASSKEDGERARVISDETVN